MEPSATRNVLATVKRLVVIVLARLRRALGTLVQVVQRNEIAELSQETKRLGSASVESVSYVGAELRALNDRLASVEEDLAALRRLLERRAEADGAEPASTAAEPISGD